MPVFIQSPLVPLPTFESNQNISLTDYLSLADIDNFAKQASSRSAFATRLLEAVFTDTNEIVNRNVRGVKGKNALDPAALPGSSWQCLSNFL